MALSGWRLAVRICAKLLPDGLNRYIMASGTATERRWAHYLLCHRVRILALGSGTTTKGGGR